MDLLYPDDYNRITRRLHNNFDKLLSREPIDYEARTPDDFLQGFHGDIEWILSNRGANQQNFSTLSIEDPEKGGLVVYGLDLGHGIGMLFAKCLQPNLSYNQRFVLRKSIGLKGGLAVDFLTAHSSSIGSIPPLDEVRYEKTMEIAINVYWRKLVEDYPWINRSTINDDYHSIIISFLLDHGFSDFVKISKIMSLVYNDERSILAHYLYQFSHQPNLPSIYSERRKADAAFLLRDLLSIESSVGLGCVNLDSDMYRVCEILTELGFSDPSQTQICEYTYSISNRYDTNSRLVGWEVEVMNNFNQPSIKHIFENTWSFSQPEVLSIVKELMDTAGEVVDDIVYPKTGSLLLGPNQHNLYSDFSAITQFKKLALGYENTQASITPGDTTHLWLSSSDAPKLIDLENPIRGISSCVFNSNSVHKLPHWVSSVIESSGEIFDKIQNVENDYGGDINCYGFHIYDLKSDELSFKISIPSMDTNTTSSIYQPNYHRNTMRIILQAILSHPLVLSGDSIHLNDVELAREGLCTIQPYDHNEVHAPTDFAFIQISRPQIITSLPLDLSSKFEGYNYATTSLSTGNELSVSQNLTPFLSINEQEPEDIQDFQEKATFYQVALRDVLTNEFEDPLGNVISPAVPDPLPINTAYLLGIRNWADHKLCQHTKDQYNDTLVLLWNDGVEIRSKEYLYRTTPRLTRSYRSIFGDLHVKPGRYKFSLSEDSGEKYFKQISPIKCGRDFDKTGVLHEDSDDEIVADGLRISAGGTSLVVEKFIDGCQVIYGGVDSDSPLNEIFEILMSELNYSLGDEILYSLVNSQDILANIDSNQQLQSAYNQNNNSEINVQYNLQAKEIFNESNAKIGVEVHVKNNINLPPFVVHFRPGVTIQSAEDEVESMLGMGLNPNQNGYNKNGYYYPKAGDVY